MKKIVLIISILFIPILAIASSNSRFHVISSFEKGQNSHINEFSVPQNQGLLVQNIRVNDVYGGISKRDQLLKYGGDGDTGTTAVTGLHRFYKNDGTSKLMCSTSTLLRYGNDDTGAFTTMETGLTDGKRWQFVTYQNKAIGTNGSDRMVKYDGHTQVTANTDASRSSGLLVAQLGAPFAELQTGTSLDASGWYQYKVAFYDGSVYSYSDARSNPLQMGTTVCAAYLTDIPIGPAGTTARYVYRTLGNSTQANVEADTTFYKIATISNNSTKVLTDDMADSVADDDNAPTWATVSAGTNATPPLAKYIEIHRERLFASGNSTYPSDLYFSDTYNPDYFDPSDYESIREDDGDEITFVKELAGSLIVGKTNSIVKYYTDATSSDDWYPSVPFSKVGCIAPYSAAITPIGIIYYGRFGLYAFNGANSSLISDAVTPEVRDVATAGLNDAVGFFFNNEYHFSYTSESSGSSYNNRELIYDIIRDAYVIDYKNINCYEAFDGGTDFGALYSGSSTTDGYVFAHSGSSSILSKRYKSELDLGTFDDTRTYGTDNDPELEIAWDCTIDTWLAECQTKATMSTLGEMATAIPGCIIDRPDTSGTWTSPVYTVNASNFDKLYWNENLGSYGDITFQMKVGATNPIENDWGTAVSIPNGSDVSGNTGNTYLQIRANLSTTDITYTPTLYEADGYVFKLIYSKVGSAYETSFLSKWESGWMDFGVPGHKKAIERIKILYLGTSGTLNFEYKNEEGDFIETFAIDLSVDPATDNNDQYTGEGIYKVYTYFPPLTSPTQLGAVGQFWKYTLYEAGLVDWTVFKIETQYTAEELYD